MEKKVYCKECRHYGIMFFGWNCCHPDNIFCDENVWDERKYGFLKDASEINKRNNCNLYCKKRFKLSFLQKIKLFFVPEND